MDYYRDVVSFAEFIGVLSKRGPYYSLEGENIGQGMVKTMDYLKKSPETLDKIVKMCYNAVIKPVPTEEDV